MIPILQILGRALRRLTVPASAAAGPDPSERAALAVIAAVGLPGSTSGHVEAARQGLLSARATTREGAVLLEAARFIGSCASGEPAEGRALGRAAERLLEADGVPDGNPDEVARALLALALARAWAARRAITPSLEADAALVTGSDALFRLQGEQEALPGPRASPVSPLLPSATPVSWTLYDCALAWGLVQGAPASVADPLVASLTGRAAEGVPQPLAGDRWALWSWRETGLAVGHTRMLKRPGRVFLDARQGYLQWDLPGLPVLKGGVEPGGSLAVSRVDGRKLRMIAETKDARWRRDVLAQGTRLIVKDAGIQQVRFIVPTFDYSRSADGWTGRGDGLSLEIKVDAGWRWTLDGGTLTGLREEGAGEVQTSLELRTSSDPKT